MLNAASGSNQKAPKNAVKITRRKESNDVPEGPHETGGGGGLYVTPDAAKKRDVTAV